MSVSIKFYESFFSLPDSEVSGDRSNHTLSVTSDQWWSQVFKIQSTEIPYIFFMAASTDITKLRVSICESTDGLTVGTEKGYVICSSALKIDEKSSLDDTDASWYRWDISAALSTLDTDYYAIVFSTTGIYTPNIYYTENYNSSVFTKIMATTSSSDLDWSNDNFTISQNGIGSICCGFLGNEVDESTGIGSGDIVLGGSNISRGYPIYIYVEKVSGSSNFNLKMSISDSTSNYNLDQTSNTYMKWYYFQPGTIPVSDKATLYNRIEKSANVTSTSDFILFTQPDLFPPYSKVFFPEKYITLQSEEIPINIIATSRTDSERSIQSENAVIINQTDNLDTTITNWARFKEKRNLVRNSSNDIRDFDKSTNPPYIDFTLEKEQDLEPIFCSTLSSEYIRGYTSVVKFKGYYFSFAKYLTASPVSISNNLATISVKVWGKVNEDIVMNTSITSIDLSINNNYGSIVGVYDTKTFISEYDNKEVLLVLFQVIPSSNKPYFVLGYLHEDNFTISNSNQIVCVDSPNTDTGNISYYNLDANFDSSSSSIDVDIKGAKFVQSPEQNMIYYTVRNYSGIGFGFWKIDISANVLSGTWATNSILEVFGKNRKFNPTSGAYECEITSCLQTADDEVYYGICNAEFPYLQNTSSGRLGEVYRLKKNASNRNAILIGDVTQRWLFGYTCLVYESGLSRIYQRVSDPSTYNGTDTVNDIHYDMDNPNSNVAFMTMVGDILHVWVTPYHYGEGYSYGYGYDYNSSSISYNGGMHGGTPFHIGIDVKNNVAKVLRRFPIYVENDITLSTDANEILDYGYDGTSFNDIKNDPNYTGLNVQHITGGTVCGEKIYICGMGKDESIEFWEYEISQVSWTPRWFAYDKRTINSAFYKGSLEYSAVPYEQIPIKPGDIDGNNLITGLEEESKWKLYYSGLVYPFYELKSTEVSNSVLSHVRKYGYYKPYSFEKIEDEGSQIYNDYPSLCPYGGTFNVNDYGYFNDTNTHTDYTIRRISKYITPVFSIESGSIFNERNPRIASQNGIPFLFTDNLTEGFHVYKHYGMFQDSKDWGYYYKHELDDVIHTYNIHGFNYIYNNYSKCFISEKSYLDSSKEILISTCEDINYLSCIRSNETSEFNADNKNVAVYHITSGVKKPQNVSFFYKMKYDRDESVDVSKSHMVGTIPITDYIKDTVFTNSDNTIMCLKSASSYEGLFYNPTKKIEMGMAYDFSKENIGSVILYHNTFNTDVNDVFWRLECIKLPTPYDPDFTWDGSGYDLSDYGFGDSQYSDTYAEIYIKGLKFNDINLSIEDIVDVKKVAVNGILTKKLSYGSEIEQKPESVLGDNGVLMSSENEIIFDIPSPINISEINFRIPDTNMVNINNNVKFNVYYLPRIIEGAMGTNMVSEDDWILLDSIIIQKTTIKYKDVIVDNLNVFAQSIRITLDSSVSVPVSNLSIKTFASSSTYSYGSSVGDIPNYSAMIESGEETFLPEMIVVDDIRSLITGKTQNSPWTFTSFGLNEGYLILDLGYLLNDSGTLKYTSSTDERLYPINKISLNAIGSVDANISIGLLYSDIDADITSSSWDWKYNDQIVNYEYCLVSWSSQTTIDSNKVYVEVLSNTNVNLLAEDPLRASYNFSETANFSTYFADGALNGCSFRPNVKKDKVVPIVNSDSEDSSSNWDGVLTFNMQMDANGPFAGEIGQIGIIEKTTTVSFPVVGVRKIAIKVNNVSNNRDLIMNGLKIYTPLLNQETGIPDWPESSVSWDFNFTANSI